MLASFKTVSEYQRNSTGWPDTWTMVNFTQAWTQGHIGEYTLNSLIVTVFALVILAIVVVPAGYAFAQLPFRGSRILLAGFISLIIISPGLQLVPLVQLANVSTMVDLRIGANSYAGLALIYVAFSLPFFTYLMSAYFEGVPRSIFEAADIDGAGSFRAFRSIAVPIALPGLLTLATFGFLNYWNDYVFALVIMTDPASRTLPVGVALLQSQYFTSQPLMAAGLVLTMVPCVLVFMLLQRNLSEGLTVGAVRE